MGEFDIMPDNQGEVHAAQLRREFPQTLPGVENSAA